MLEKFLSNYVDKLYINSNKGMCSEQQGLYSKKDYYELLKPVIDMIQQHRDYSIQELRNLLYVNSDIENKVREFVLKKETVPGLVFTYGTNKFRETVIVGNRQEVKLDNNGHFTPSLEKMTRDTIFDLASITKIFTALSILKLIQRGEIGIFDRVGKFCPEFINIKDVTIFDLLTFNVPLITDSRIDNASSKEEAEEILFNIKIDKSSLNLNPYTDMGAMILKYIIERVTGLDYYKFVDYNILIPLGMNDTYVQVPSRKLDRVASENFVGKLVKSGDIIIDNTIKKGNVYDPKARVMGQTEGNLSGHAGMFSTVEDMTKLAKGLISNIVIDEKYLEMMVKNRRGKKYIADDGQEKYVQYLGMMCYSKHPRLSDSELFHAMSGHSFGSAGWSGTQLTIDPINELFFFMASNRAHNRLVYIDQSQKDRLVNINGRKSIILPSGEEMIDASKFAWDRDPAIVHPALKLSIQYKMLEDFFYLLDKNIKEEESLRNI